MVKSKIRILHLIKSLGRGGAEKLIPETAVLHDREQYEFYCLYFYHQPHNMVEELQHVGIKVSCFPASALSLPMQVNPVSKFVKDHQIDIIHSHLPWAGVLGRAVAIKTGLPLVYTEHNIWERYNFLSYWLNKLTFSKQDIVVPVSEEVECSITRGYRIKGKGPEIRTIPNGVNVETFIRKKTKGEETRAALGIPGEDLVIGTVAVFRAQKRLPIWVALAKEIWAARQDVHFILVGSGAEWAKVKKCIGDGHFAQHIHLVGTQKEVVPYLSAMDIYMSTSQFEGLPIAMLEGMACELPVISTCAGGIGEVIREGKEGHLCPVDNPSNLLPLALDLLANKSKLKEMGKNARNRVEEVFSMKRMVNQLERVYQEVLQKLS
ncbi:glycosyltransferase [Echinicola sediminis]